MKEAFDFESSCNVAKAFDFGCHMRRKLWCKQQSDLTHQLSDLTEACLGMAVAFRRSSHRMGGWTVGHEID